MRIENIRIKNYRLFRDVELLGLPKLTVVVGANGSGKSTLFDVFTFLKDALTHNVAAAVTRRGGFRELVSRGTEGPIGIAVQFRESGGRLATYLLEVATENGQIVVAREVLRYRRGRYGKPWYFVDFRCGEGSAITNDSVYGQEGAQAQREEFKLDDPSVLAIKGLGQFKRFRVACEIRRLIETWHVSDASPGVEEGYAEHVSNTGYNLARVAWNRGKPHPLLLVAEPEKHLYPSLIPGLVEQFRDFASGGGQVFVSTHSPLLLDCTRLEEIFWLVKEVGITEVRRASTDDLLRDLVAEGDKLGDLWRQALLPGAGPQPAKPLTREHNRSPSFQAMMDGVERLASRPPTPNP